MTLLGLGSQSLGRGQTQVQEPNSPDCTCNGCGQCVEGTESRWRCSQATCDDVHLCHACCQTACPQCGTSPHDLYRDEGSAFVLRRRVFHESFVSSPASTSAVRPWTMVDRAFRVYAARPLIGEPRAHGRIEWWSYAHCGVVARAFARELRVNSAAVNAAAVLLCASNSAGWLIVDWACALAAIPSITVDASVSVADALATARSAARRQHLMLVAACVDGARVADWRQQLLHAGHEAHAGRSSGSSAQRGREEPLPSEVAVVIYSTSELRRRLMAAACSTPTAAAADTPSSVPQGSDDSGRELVTCLFSFGSTGAPKPLWFDAERWAEWGERNPPLSRRGRAALARRSVRVSCAALFAPLSHGLARRTAWGELLHGGRIGLCSPRGTDGSERVDRSGDGALDDEPSCSDQVGCSSLDLLEQIQLFGPTQLSAAPRFYSLYRKRYNTEMARAIAALQTGSCTHGSMADAGRFAKDHAHASAAAMAAAAVRRLGGPRLRLVAVGGAVVPPALLDFLRDCFGHGGIGGGQAMVSNGYAMAEIPGGIARDGLALPGVEIRIVTQEGHVVTEQAQHGEILVKTSRGVIVGSDGRAAVDADGWFHTGDVGMWMCKGGERRLQVVDRIGFTVKLANGEFFAPQQVEWTFEQRCPSIASCILFARAGDTAPIAIVIPQQCVEESGAALVTEAQPVNARTILEEMQQAAAAAGLRGWELPSQVLLDEGPWDEASGCCSTHGKLRRLAIAKRHQLTMQAQGASSANRHLRTESATNVVGSPHEDDTTSDPTIGMVLAFLSAASDAEARAGLPSASVVENGADWWAALGGDSVAAIELIASWEQVELKSVPMESSLEARVRLTVRDVFNLTLWQLRRKARSRLHSMTYSHRNDPDASDGVDHESVSTGDVTPGADDDEPPASLVSRTAVVSPTSFWEGEARRHILAHVRSEPSSAVDPVRGIDGGPCVLLTGATGFLGPHLLRAILAPPCSWALVIVLVRGSADRIPLPPVTAGNLEAGYIGPNGCRVIAVVADFAQPDLGMRPSDLSMLRRTTVNALVHSAAVVDHARSYEALRSVNVSAVSTLVDLIAPTSGDRPALPPRIIFVSTMSVIPVASAAAEVGWSGPAESLVPAACAAALESGYAQSKLIAEHRLAHDALSGRFRLIIARLGLIGATDATMQASGEALCSGGSYTDRRDWLSLLLCAVEATGASPAGLTSGERAVAVLPVNLAAEALAAEAARYEEHVQSDEGQHKVLHLDASAFGIQPRLLSSLLDEVERARGPGAPPLRRELPYHAWRRLVAKAGPPAVLALAMLPAEARGGALRLPSGARRRLREIERNRSTGLSSRSALS